MAYKFKITETPERGLRRLGVDQIERAERALCASGQSNGGIHETRKCMKRIRALLRLVRPGLDESAFQKENARYREISRQLSSERDAQILNETVLKLEPSASTSDLPAIAALKQHLDAARPAPETVSADTKAASVCEHLAAAKSVMAKLDVGGSGFESVEHGLRDSYRKGCRLFERAYRSGIDETFHDWRKSVQLHWRHMALLSRAWPDMVSARVEAARQLSQILGDSQDLSVLIVYIKGLPATALPKPAAERLVRLALKRQKHLRAAAEPRGAQLYSLPPKSLARSVMACWHAAKAIEIAASDAPSAPAVSVAVAVDTNSVAEAKAAPELSPAKSQVKASATRAKRSRTPA